LMPQPLIQTVGITNTTSVMANGERQFYRLRIED